MSVRGNNSKALGTAAELRAARELEAAGYLVIRSAASKSPVDLVAIGPLGVRLIQVKRDSGRSLRPYLIEAIKEELRAIPRGPNTTCELWVGRVVDRKFQWIRQEVV
jgi:Holliday junction resolvase